MDIYTLYIISVILVLPVFIYSAYSQLKVNSVFDKYASVLAKSGITASELTARLLRNANINNVSIKRINGKLSDCYDPRSKTVKLSGDVYDSSSIASLGVCAHEVGHAIQDAKGNLLFKARRIIVPITNIITSAFIPLMIIGSIFSFLLFIPTIGYYIILASVISYGASLLVYFVTLPLEYDASRQALALLSQTNTLDSSELSKAKQVLSAAIHTYISAFLTSLIYFLRFLSLLLMFSDRRR